MIVALKATQGNKDMSYIFYFFPSIFKSLLINSHIFNFSLMFKKTGRENLHLL